MMKGNILNLDSEPGGGQSAHALETQQRIFPRDPRAWDACSSEGRPAGRGALDGSPLSRRPSPAGNTDNVHVCEQQER